MARKDSSQEIHPYVAVGSFLDHGEVWALHLYFWSYISLLPEELKSLHVYMKESRRAESNSLYISDHY